VFGARNFRPVFQFSNRSLKTKGASPPVGICAAYLSKLAQIFAVFDPYIDRLKYVLDLIHVVTSAIADY
jgi:hypothetical protein